jgi:hypothetical protein
MPLNAAKVKSRIFFTNFRYQAQNKPGPRTLGCHFCPDRNANRNGENRTQGLVSAPCC